MVKHYTYLHRKKDTNEVFYIGKGIGNRASQFSRRSDEWKQIAQNGFIIEIVANWKTENEAYDHERFLIKCFRDLGHPLLNCVGGGAGGVFGFRNGMFGKVSAMRGKKQTVLGLQSIITRANSLKNRTVFENVVCPHCGKESNLGNAKRWHFDNCKYKNE